ncbi:MAG: hypothetical protein IT353_15470 [Gemmatimonadaceae bacterium]|nr:hypothetical protein [Gemmatimonadaceae bacterium]
MKIRTLALGALVAIALLATTSNDGWAQEPPPTRAHSGGGAEMASPVTEDNRLAIRDLIDFQIFASYRERATSASPYTSDAVLVVGKSRYPLGTRTNNTEVSVWRDVTTRCRRPSEQGRPLVSKVAFLEQSDSSAHVKISGTFTSFANQEIPSAVTNLKNEGWFVKQGGEWKISRWQIYPDLTGCSN